MIPALTTRRSQAPRRRFRGKRRYFRRVHRNAASFRLEHGPGSWWDLWHYHADWPGWGNLGWRYRLQHIRALTEVFRGIARDARQLSTPFQTWICLSGADAGQDATYVHSPNKNQSVFPLELPGTINWEHRELLPIFNELLPGVPLRIGELRAFDEFAEPPRDVSTFFIYSPHIGVPLEPGYRQST